MYAIVEVAYAPHDPEGRVPGRHPAGIGGAPFTWFGDPCLSWWVAGLEGRDVAFALWRHVGRNAHLHSFFVAAEAQRRGVGRELLAFHVRQAAVENGALESLTLHVREEATWAQRFYAANGYAKRDPRTIPLDESSGLGDWVRAYEQRGWPEAGKVLMVRARGGAGVPGALPDPRAFRRDGEEY